LHLARRGGRKLSPMVEEKGEDALREIKRRRTFPFLLPGKGQGLRPCCCQKRKRKRMPSDFIHFRKDDGEGEDLSSFSSRGRKSFSSGRKRNNEKKSWSPEGGS